MRYFRSLGAAALATATGIALVGTAITSAQAAPSSLYPPSALVLTIGKGEKASTATVVRAVTLTCSPAAGGTHPDAESACAEMTAAGGDFRQVTKSTGDRPCTREWDPVTVTGDGVWQGKRVSWSARYGNTCEMRARTAEATVFAF
ncbi:subtilase-type protease inhibitor [Streptomyces sp. NPDC085481]|uniref:subtilase-type protease inhibitor n=1 Tax=Streptomyces sp. NPDC085481 TaxID=3365727 RepID=UPI0037D91CB6